jgi:hypothetical protein
MKRVSAHRPETVYSIDGLSAMEFGYIVACMGVQSSSRNDWQYSLYTDLANAAIDYAVSHTPASFLTVKAPV